MKAKELAGLLMKNPESEVVILEGQKFDDNIPYQRILMVNEGEFEDNEGESHCVVEITVEANPKTYYPGEPVAISN